MEKAFNGLERSGERNHVGEEFEADEREFDDVSFGLEDDLNDVFQPRYMLDFRCF